MIQTACKTVGPHSHRTCNNAWVISLLYSDDL